MTMTPSEPLPPEPQVWGRLAAAGLLILGAKFFLVHSYGSPLPAWDQWQAEGDRLIRPWLAGELGWADLLARHNEHRILLTRLFVLLLLGLNHQWDALVETTGSAVLHTVYALVLGAILLRRQARGPGGLLLGLLVLLFSLPFNWENTLSGFQSQFYFLLLNSTVAIWGLTRGQVGQWRWCLGLLGAILACLSMGSGVLASLAVALWCGLKLIVRRPRRRGDVITLAVAGTIFVAGFLLSKPPGQEGQPNPFVARSSGEFLCALGNVLGWPNVVSPVLAIPAYLPLGYLAWRWLGRARAPLGPAAHGAPPSPGAVAAEDFLLPMGLWTILQAAALAWGRGNYRGLAQSGLGVSRYMDLASIGVLVNFACLLCIAPGLLASGRLGTARGRSGMRVLIALWPAVVVVGLGTLTVANFRDDLPFQSALNDRQDRLLTALARTGDLQALSGASLLDIRCEDPKLVVKLLVEEPLMRPVLPPPLRPPLALSAGEAPEAQGFHARGGSPPAAETAADINWTTTGAAAGLPAVGGRAASFLSRPVRSGLPYLDFQIHDTNVDTLQPSQLRLRPSADADGSPAGSAWLAESRSGFRILASKHVLLRAPSSPFRVEARTQTSPGGAGMTFSDPSEMGWLSALTRFVLGWDCHLLIAGGAWLSTLACHELFSKMENRRQPSSPAAR